MTLPYHGNVPSMAMPNAGESSPRTRPIHVPATSTTRLSRQARVRRSVLRYLAVWAAVAAMALIAQAVAPAAT